MSNLLSQIYDKIVCEESGCVEVKRAYDEDVEAVLKQFGDRLSEEEFNDLLDMIYKATNDAERSGFMLGVNTAIKFLTEAMHAVND